MFYKKLPKTKYGNLIMNRLDKFIKLTSFRNKIPIHKIAIQLYNLKDEQIKEKIISLIDLRIKDTLDDLNNKIDKLSNYLLNNINSLSENIYTKYVKIINIILINLYSSFMDIYLLTRLFRFNDSKYVLIYAGVGH